MGYGLEGVRLSGAPAARACPAAIKGFWAPIWSVARALRNDAVQRNGNYRGFDLIGETIQHHRKIEAEFRDYILTRYELLSAVAGASQCDWSVMEFWMPFRAQFAGQTKDGVPLEKMVPAYYRMAVREYLDFQGAMKPVGFVFHPWAEVKGSETEATLKDFFSKF